MPPFNLASCTRHYSFVFSSFFALLLELLLVQLLLPLLLLLLMYWFCYNCRCTQYTYGCYMGYNQLTNRTALDMAFHHLSTENSRLSTLSPWILSLSIKQFLFFIYHILDSIISPLMLILTMVGWSVGTCPPSTVYSPHRRRIISSDDTLWKSQSEVKWTYWAIIYRWV